MSSPDRRSTPTIDLPRLRLTPSEESDAAPMFVYRSDDSVGRYQNFRPETLEDVITFIRRSGEQPFGTPGHWAQLAVRTRDPDALIGDAGVHVEADDPLQAEIGITLDPGSQGHGYAAEAVAGLLDHLFGPMALHRVFASVDPRNAAAVALMSRVGLRKEAHFVQSYRFHGAWADDAVFGILSSEWKSRGS